ncbi:enoyl-CoA hydratase/isomerase family protein [Cupriavidus consociatus]|uniref:enoyl-CoA hydratase/isomerase family protein n=1 Tax=Cupriavidus consociatus TaxID=2821357 RepID=UPI001AE85633|nr:MULTISPECIES: enoyl-CoA hydratase-related protein [unclassified Cupriavidus]MBP0619411.1 enoyl-CoA hydratase/isomerase family protein [Cupriavidus sp. LEh25]MDK2656059.1 enoyl-CoA hydratase-related protein [Cupriavidus sp. LEh21]
MTEPTQTEPVIVRRAGGVLFATLNIPASRNALAPEVVSALAAAVEQSESDTEVRALVLRGAGGMFSAGGNVGNFQARLDADASREDPVATRNRQFGDFMQRLSALPVPVIAAVDGAAMGGGMGLACAADIVVATRDARFALSETTLGIIAAQIAPFVVQRIGAAATRRLGLTGERISGEAAVAIGLVDQLADDSAELDALLAEWLTRIGRCGPHANRVFKTLVGRCGQEPAGPLLDEASRLFAQCMRSEGAEGVAAFREKRDASWTVRFDADAVRAAQSPG